MFRASLGKGAAGFPRGGAGRGRGHDRGATCAGKQPLPQARITKQAKRSCRFSAWRPRRGHDSRGPGLPSTAGAGRRTVCAGFLHAGKCLPSASLAFSLLEAALFAAQVKDLTAQAAQGRPCQRRFLPITPDAACLSTGGACRCRLSTSQTAKAILKLPLFCAGALFPRRFA